ncbi:hypothetical protein KKE14_03040 [Patescibacteria group bacterium]|nr:hypothetical protein [Patescibacteria group bacterium]
MKKINNFLKYITALGVCVLIRLLPWRVPNVEPIMGTLLPISKGFGYASGFLFGFISIIIFDSFTMFGVWTWVTAIAYGLVGLGGAWWLKNRKPSAKNFVAYSIVATLAYDFMTGPIMSSVVFKMSFMQTLIGQIPFTLWHLGGNIILAGVLSPILYKWVISNPEFSIQGAKNLLVSRSHAK